MTAPFGALPSRGLFVPTPRVQIIESSIKDLDTITLLRQGPTGLLTFYGFVKYWKFV